MTATSPASTWAVGDTFFDLPEPSSVDDLVEQEQYREFMGASGTNSIFDVHTVIPADFDGDYFGTTRPLTEPPKPT